MFIAKPQDLPALSSHDELAVTNCDGMQMRALTMDDYPAIVAILLNPRVWEQSFGDGYEARPTCTASAYRFLYHEILTPDREPFALVLNGDVVGMVSYFRCEPENARVEVGKLLLAEELWGRGYMGAALDALLRHAFTVGYHRVAAEADELNGRSIRSLTRAGFMLEGIRRHSSFHADGSRRDICTFSVTLDDVDVLRRLRVKLPA